MMISITIYNNLEESSSGMRSFQIGAFPEKEQRIAFVIGYKSVIFRNINPEPGHYIVRHAERNLAH